jgi:hypothetical protein
MAPPQGPLGTLWSPRVVSHQLPSAMGRAWQQLHVTVEDRQRRAMLGSDPPLDHQRALAADARWGSTGGFW